MFDFPDATTLNLTDGNPNTLPDTDPSSGKGKWTLSFYGSDPQALASNGALTFEPTDGDPTAGSLKASAAFAATVGSEKIGLVYNIAPWGQPASLANVSGRVFSARVKLVTSPHTNCAFTATAWSTTDTGTAGTDFTVVNAATSPALVVGSWVTATFDLDLSVNKLRVNQVGIDIKSTCTGTAVGTGNTVVELDHATLSCK